MSDDYVEWVKYGQICYRIQLRIVSVTKNGNFIGDRKDID
jgi:hypothetical protein